MRAAPLVLTLLALGAAGCEVETRTALAPRALTIQAGGGGTGPPAAPPGTGAIPPAPVAPAAPPASTATAIAAPVTTTVSAPTGAVDACRSGDPQAPVEVVYVSGGGGSGVFRLVRPGSLTDVGAWPEGQRLRALCGRDGPDGLIWLRAVDDAGNSGWVASRFLSPNPPVVTAPRPVAPATIAAPAPPLAASPTIAPATAFLTPAGVAPTLSPAPDTPTPTITPPATATGTPTSTPTATATPTNTPTATATPTSCYFDEEIILAPVVTTDVVRFNATITITVRSARTHNNVRLEAAENPERPQFQGVLLRGDIWEWMWTVRVATTNAHEYRFYVSTDQLCRRKRVTVTA